MAPISIAISWGLVRRVLAIWLVIVMKFVYVDESGGNDQSDVFVIMCSLIVDEYTRKAKVRRGFAVSTHS